MYVVAIAVLFAAGILLGYTLAAMGDDDEDRPPIYVRNSSVDIEVLNTGVPGRIDKSASGPAWAHDHPNPGPKHLTVSISGTASSCGTNGTYYGSNVRDLSVQYTVGDVTRNVTFAVHSSFFFFDRYLEITPDPNATTSQPNNHSLVLEGAGTLITQVTLNGPGKKQFVCAMDTNATPEIRIHQIH